MTAQRHYPALDAARGLAALVIVLYHLRNSIYPQLVDPAMPGLLKHCHLAVDLFFLMSGLVIARAYEARLRNGSLSFAGFLRVRLIRLYPLFALGTLLGFAYVVLRGCVLHETALPLSGADDPLTTPLQLVAALLANLLFLPAMPLGSLFPFDPVAWTLSLEWFVNLAYAAVALQLRTSWLVALTAGAALGLTTYALNHGYSDIGWGVSSYAGGVWRIGFSFSLGVVLFRLLAQGRLRVPALPAWLLLIGLACLLVTPFGQPGLIYELACILLGFPLFVVFACQATMPARWEPACLLAGAVSYALYILHYPLMDWASGGWKFVTHNPPAAQAAASGPALLLLMLIVPYLATIWFDEPLRRRLR